MSIPKLIAILGPTSSGKSDLAVEIAEQWNGEVVSADSRQVYRGLDIGTGKITASEMRGIPHHLLDVADPKEQYSVVRYKRDAEKAIDDILSRGKLPILCGGTGLYIDAVCDNAVTPETLPNEDLRAELGTKSAEELFSMLQKLDPARAGKIDPKNPRRLIRAIEIARDLGSVPPIAVHHPKCDVLRIGIRTDQDALRARIEARLEKRLENGMLEEAESLRKDGLSFERMSEIGIEYRHMAEYLQGNITLEEMKNEILFKSGQYAKRQMIWFKRDERIKWFPVDYTIDIFSLIKNFVQFHL
ncbi:MAG: tRNA (adenosine(37)-N6)-dimethylallyltransferase MiaA [Parcubacteria group bacterium]|nr:tRNA (adenosine(37)-N6)-dimethylallyltransferase MiaA [Parcubacteria group bacterium]